MVGFETAVEVHDGNTQRLPHHIEPRRHEAKRDDHVREKFRGSVSSFASIDNLSSSTNFHDNNDHDPHHDDHDVGRISLYSRPLQRQKWGETQVLPHINWGDLFFDLFYVAGAYKLGVFLTTAFQTAVFTRGLVYFIAMFGPIWNIWFNKFIYDARYTSLDYFHRFIDVVRILLLSMAIIQIKDFQTISDPSHHNLCYFSFFVFVEAVINIIMGIELMVFGVGDPELKSQARRVCLVQFLPLALFYCLAWVISLMNDNERHRNEASSTSSYGSYGSDKEGSGTGSGSGYDMSGSGNETAGSNYDNVSGSGYDMSGSGNETAGSNYDNVAGAGHRHLEVVAQWTMTDIPIVLLFCGYFFSQFAMLISPLFYKSSRSRNDRTVPINVDFAIHRLGEWIMLMLGESILSLLAVGVNMESINYYFVVICGLLTVIILQNIHFESQPHHAEFHALKRSHYAGVLYVLVIQSYSMALISFGVMYKFFLQVKLSKSYQELGGWNRALFVQSGVDYMRELPAKGKDNDTPENRQIASNLYCCALTIIIISMEMMTLTHKGVKNNINRCLSRDVSYSWTTTARVMFVLSKVLALFVLMMMSQIVTDPEVLSGVGASIVFVFELLRIIGWELFSKSDRSERNAAVV